MKKAEFRDRLREAMELRGRRAVDLVDETGIPKVTISYYLSGKTEPKADRIYWLAKALNVSEAWLLGYDVPLDRADWQKKNDKLAELVVRLRSDTDFFDVVYALGNMPDNEYESFKTLILSRRK